MVKKRVVVCLEHRFYRVGDNVYTALSFPYSYWEDYLTYFDDVTVVARVKKVDKVDDNYVLSSGHRVQFSDFPYYVGPLQFAGKIFSLIYAALRIAINGDKFLLRSGNVSNLVWLFVLLFRKDYIREFPGNIKEGIIGATGGGIFYPIALFLDYISRFQSRFSKANSFVSDYCKSIYMSGANNFVFSSFRASEISVRKSDFSPSCPFTISCVGRIEGEKGHASLLRALHLVSGAGISCRLVLIGDGSRRAELEDLANRLGINVWFAGTITDRQRIFEMMLASDLFVLPSLTEGMPRALLEAMAVGLPCVATCVGGIPEVLSDYCMVPPDSPRQLADKILEFSKSEERRLGEAERNFRLIQDRFSDARLKIEKEQFWSCLYE